MPAPGRNGFQRGWHEDCRQSGETPAGHGTRAVPITLVGAALGMIALMFALAVPGKTAVSADPPLSASEVLSSIPGSEATNDALSYDSANGSYRTANVPGAADFLIPAPLRTVLNQDNASQPLLKARLASVPLADRQQFLDEFSGVVARATQRAASWEWDNRERYVAAVMNQYARVRIKRIGAARSAIQAARGRSERLDHRWERSSHWLPCLALAADRDRA